MRSRANSWQPIEKVWLADLDNHTRGMGAFLDPEEVPDVMDAIRRKKQYQIRDANGRATYMFAPTGTPGQALLLEYEPSWYEQTESRENPLDSRRKAQILKERKLKKADLLTAGKADLLLIIKKSGSGPAAQAAQAEIARRAAKRAKKKAEGR